VLGSVLVGDVVQDEYVELILKTMDANSFNFIMADLSAGVHTIKVKARIDTDVSGTAEAKGSIGKGSVTVESVRMIRNEDFNLHKSGVRPWPWLSLPSRAVGGHGQSVLRNETPGFVPHIPCPPCGDYHGDSSHHPIPLSLIGICMMARNETKATLRVHNRGTNGTRPNSAQVGALRSVVLLR